MQDNRNVKARIWLYVVLLARRVQLLSALGGLILLTRCLGAIHMHLHVPGIAFSSRWWQTGQGRHAYFLYPSLAGHKGKGAGNAQLLYTAAGTMCKNLRYEQCKQEHHRTDSASEYHCSKIYATQVTKGSHGLEMVQPGAHAEVYKIRKQSSIIR